MVNLLLMIGTSELLLIAALVLLLFGGPIFRNTII